MNLSQVVVVLAGLWILAGGFWNDAVPVDNPAEEREVAIWLAVFAGIALLAVLADFLWPSRRVRGLSPHMRRLERAFSALLAVGIAWTATDLLLYQDLSHVTVSRYLVLLGTFGVAFILAGAKGR